MASFAHALLLFLAHLHIHLSTISTRADAGNLTQLPVPLRCHPDQAKALLKLKKSFIGKSTTTLSSWRDGTDCCFWEGVGCDTSSGNVTVLDLNNQGLSSYGLDPAVFSLTSLRRLDLSMNYFDPNSLFLDNVPATGFERLALLTHLNLSNSGFCGQLPISIGKLVNLVSLDLSNSYSFDNVSHTSTYLVDSSNSLCLYQSKFGALVSNLSNLRELYLDGVDLSGSGEEWCISLASSVPRLQVLSLAYCGLSGPIHKSLARLHYLSVINLKGNYGITTGPFPEFFMDFLNLTVLRLPNTNLERQLPFRSFRSKNLRVLDLSVVPNSSNSNSLETSRLGRVNFPYAKRTSSNFQSLKELRLEGEVSVDFLSSFSKLGPLCHLYLSLDTMEVSDLISILSWIGYQKIFMILVLDGFDFSGITPSLVSNFINLRSLTMVECDIPRPILSAIGNLMDLQTLEMFECTTYGSMPSSVGNLTNLRNMRIIMGMFSGSLPAAIGNLTNLRNMDIESSFSGPMPAAIGNLKNLRNMHIESSFSGPMPAAIGNLKNLRNMDIESSFSGPMPAAIGNLKNLRNMDIESSFSGPMPAAIGYLKYLRNMHIESSFSGPMPAAIGNLKNLRNMHIESSFSGPMPAAIGNLTNLETMEILGDFVGTVPYAIGQLTKLTRLVLPGCNFYGRIPSSVVNLTQLTILDLSDNYLNGEIPPSIFTLPALRELDLSGNQLSGPMREFDKAPSQLESVYLSQNELSGPIPKEFYQLTSLKHLDVSSNNLIGLVDLTSFWRLSKLASLHLSNNRLHVMDSEGNTSHLPTDLSGPNELGLAACSITRFPRSLMRIKYMSHLDLSWNQISGDVPEQVWETWSSSLIYLNLSHNMFTSIGLTSDVLPFTTALDVLDLSFNRLRGWVPMPNSSAQILDYSNNIFSSVLPNWASYLSHTQYLSMSRNSINGRVPISICNSGLDALDLSYNNFSGSIPFCLIETGHLKVLNLRENQLEGTLPSNIATSCALQTLDLHSNKIQGLLPRALSHCTDLEILDLGGNGIADTFPSWLMGFSNLRVLVLRSNQFYGTINDTDGDTKPEECFPSLQIMDLASNNFSGSFRPQLFERLKLMTSKLNSSGEILSIVNVTTPNEFYRDSIVISYKGSDTLFERILTTLTAIDFSNNRLEGAIPESVGRLVSLRVLNLSHNAFTGKLPAQLGGMTDLESLDLSGNQLSGVIPQELTNLTFLGVLNLSNNHLVGKIPQARQFSTFGSSSFDGNAGLCGPPLSELPCGASPYAPGVKIIDKSSHHVDVVLFLFVGLGFGVGFAAAVVVKWGQIGRWFSATAGASRT